MTWQSHRAPLPRPDDTVENVDVRAESAAKWSRSLEGELERITLENGTLAIQVDHSASLRKLLVVLPDGELEDIGTTFSVTASAGHTTQVSVQDGQVVLRLGGAPPRSLGAGDAWTSMPASPVIVTASAEARPASAPPTRPAPRVKLARAPLRAPARPISLPVPTRPPISAPRCQHWSLLIMLALPLFSLHFLSSTPVTPARRMPPTCASSPSNAPAISAV